MQNDWDCFNLLLSLASRICDGITLSVSPTSHRSIHRISHRTWYSINIHTLYSLFHLAQYDGKCDCTRVEDERWSDDSINERKINYFTVDFSSGLHLIISNFWECKNCIICLKLIAYLISARLFFYLLKPRQI